MGIACLSGVIDVYAQGNPDQAVNALLPMIKDRFGSANTINQNALEPLTSDQTKLSTLDGKTHGSGQLTCPASPYFLNVFIHPSTTGDLSKVLIEQDTNFDSKIDYSYSVPVSVSGVCSNGVMSCAPGLWNNCKSYRSFR